MSIIIVFKAICLYSQNSYLYLGVRTESCSELGRKAIVRYHWPGGTSPVQTCVLSSGLERICYNLRYFPGGAKLRRPEIIANLIDVYRT